jgi:hypothetical protein
VIQLPVVRFHGIELPTDRDHAIPGAIGLEVVWFRISNRVLHLKGTEIRYLCHGAVFL